MLSINSGSFALSNEMNTYDVIYVDWNNGVTFLQRNAYVLQEVIKWVNQNKDQNPLTVYGQSMGSIIAMRTAIEMKNKIPIQIVIADGSFSSFQRIARKKLAQHWLTWIAQPFVYVLLSDRWAPDVEDLSPTPLLVLHGENDFVIEIEHGKRVYQDAREPKAYLSLPEGGHGNLFWVAGKGFRKTVLEQIQTMTQNKKE